MSWFLVGGAAIGAGVGSYGHDNWGWSKDAIWQGALVGGAGGYAAGGMAGAGAAGGATAGAGAGGGATALGSGAGTYGTAGSAAALGTTGAAGNFGAAAFGTAGAGGISMSNAMMLGQGAMGLMSGTSSQGSSFQDKMELTSEGKGLQKSYLAAGKERMSRAKAGNVSDIAFQDISNLKTAEGLRDRSVNRTMNTAQARIGNRETETLGGGALGGGYAKGLLANAGERMEGLFAPNSTLHNFRREELMNATKQIQNLNNLDNQTAMFNYSSSLSKWGANQQLATEKGQAIGQAAMNVGGMALTNAYMNKMATPA